MILAEKQIDIIRTTCYHSEVCVTKYMLVHML